MKKKILINLLIVIIIVGFIIVIKKNIKDKNINRENNRANNNRENNNILTLNKLCLANLEFADRVLKSNPKDVTFEDYVYLEDPEERMKQCKLEFKKVHGINSDILNEDKENQKFFNHMYKCMKKSKDMGEYVRCFNNIVL